MLVKKKYKESPIETLELDATSMWQKRNGNILCKIYEEKPYRETNQLKSIDYTLYVLKGSITYQILKEGEDIRNKKTATEILSGECIFLPKGYYYYWVGEEGVLFVTVTNNTPKKLFDAISATNKNLK